MDFRDIKEFIKDAFSYLIVILIVILIVVYIVTLQQVVGSSMNPTYNESDILVLSKIHYNLFEINRNDVVSLKYDNSKYLIKRVIGLPGEHVYFKDNILYINNEPYENNFETADFDLNELGYDVIPDNMYLVLGDNRYDSLDSREIGLISKEDIIGKVLFRIWPLG